jgi:hypothetical protein
LTVLLGNYMKKNQAKMKEEEAEARKLEREMKKEADD